MRGTPAGNWLKPGLGMVIMSLLVQTIGQRRRATPALLQWLHSGKGPHRLRAFLLPAGSPQSGKRKPGTSAGLGFTHSKQRGAKECKVLYIWLASQPSWSDSAWFPQPFEGKNVKYFTFG